MTAFYDCFIQKFRFLLGKLKEFKQFIEIINIKLFIYLLKACFLFLS